MKYVNQHHAADLMHVSQGVSISSTIPTQQRKITEACVSSPDMSRTHRDALTKHLVRNRDAFQRDALTKDLVLNQGI
jgi:hypothetical protein